MYMQQSNIGFSQSGGMRMSTQGQPSPVIMNSQPMDGYRVLPLAQDMQDIPNERDNQIRMQAQRVQKLEERIQLLLEESTKQDSIVNFKQTESIQWQENYNALRDDFLQKSAEMSSFEEEIDSMLKKQAQILLEIEQNETTIRNYHNDIYARNEDIQYWSDRSAQQSQAQLQLTQLEHQIEIIQQENSKLNKLLLQNSDYPK